MVSPNITEICTVSTVTSKITSVLLRAKPESLNESIADVLGRICNFTGAEQGTLFSLSEDRQSVIIVQQWPSDLDNSKKHSLSDCFGTFYKDLLDKMSVIISEPYECPILPDYTSAKANELTKRSFLLFPLLSDTGVDGVLGIYGSLDRKVEWPVEIGTLLTIISDPLLNALMRIQSEKSLQKITKQHLETERMSRISVDLSAIYSFHLTVTHDQKVVLSSLSDNYTAITGYKRDEVETVDFWRDIIHPEDMEKLLVLLNRLIHQPCIERVVCRTVIHQKISRWVQVVVQSEFDTQENRITAIYGIVKDISECVYAQEALRQTNDDLRLAKEKSDQNEKLYRVMYNSSPVLMHLTDLEGNIISVNDQWLKTMGYTVEEVLNTLSNNYLTESSRIKSKELVPELIQNGMITNLETQVVTKTGKILDILIGSKIIYDSAGKPLWRMTTSLDITDRKRVEEALRQREYYLTAIIENQPGLVWLKDSESRFLAVNHAFARSCGRDNPEELIGKTDYDAWPRELAEMYRSDDQAILKSGSSVSVEELIFDNNESKWFETFKTPVKNIQGEIIGTTGYARDITALKKEQEALNNVQKLESLGILAGGIAHDFNNLLGGIYGFLDLAALKTTDPEVSEMLSDALSTITRARGLTQQLLTFSKGGAPIKKVDSLDPFLEKTVKFALSGSRVTCTFTIPNNLWLCIFDKNQIAQVIDNLVINALQAMPDGGTIFISAENMVIAEKSVHTTLKAGQYVRISITDQGIGIPKEILSRIFDPFFSTKEKGHGLGLATCYSIIHRHEGCIDVESEPGKGSTFRFFLPAAPDSLQEQVDKQPLLKKGSGRIIIMDDEDVIRNVVGHMLNILGYTVIFTRNGDEALSILQTELYEGRSVDAMILDLTIPGGMGGQEAISKIREIDSHIPVFVASGYANNPVMASPEKYGFNGSICKPFAFLELAEMLHKKRD